LIVWDAQTFACARVKLISACALGVVQLLLPQLSHGAAHETHLLMDRAATPAHHEVQTHLCAFSHGQFLIQPVADQAGNLLAVQHHFHGLSFLNQRWP